MNGMSPVPAATVRARAMVLLALACALLSPAAQADFDVLEGSGRLADDRLDVSAELSLNLSSATADALVNGINLSIHVDVRLMRTRPWIWDDQVGSWEFPRTLSYHALSNLYTVYMTDGTVDTFQSLSEALVSLGSFSASIPIAGSVQISPSEQYQVSVRARLDHETLPPPLKLMASVSPAWRLSSEWSRWPLGN